MKNLRKLPVLLLIVSLVWSCSNDDDATTPPAAQPLNIVQIAQATADLSMLVEAVIQTGLVDALSADGQRTVLAPTNAAFQDLLDSNMAWNSISDIDNAVLTQVLLNHVIDNENILSGALAGNTGYRNTLASGPGGTNLSIFFNGNAGVTFNGSSSVVSGLADISTSNGIVHVVDTVIALPTLLTFATADDTFSSLEASVLLPNQGAVATVLTNATPTAPLTVLAPTNAAFTALLNSNPAWNGPGDIDDATLTAVLTHHVTAGNVTSGSLTNPGTTTAPSVQGQDFSITLPGTNGNIADVTDGSNNTDIGIIAVDVQASNGVIHAVNKVLLPM
ncbi:fasciclin domain-containing protein [Lacinutrix sp.]|uniref:fasciclin domain-containing protein n=1 Tax=Lacinutrix sp. TaxID=1937692 RepID=UPI0035C82190